MEHVFSVPVKSLVKTEESEEEEEEVSRGEEQLAPVLHNDTPITPSVSESDLSSTSEETGSGYSTSSEEPQRPSVADARHLQSSRQHLEGAIHHLFLPKRIPDTTQPALLQDTELWILQHAMQTCNEVLNGHVKLRPISKMVSSWKALQPKSSRDRNQFTKRFPTYLHSMDAGDTIPIYCMQQNCTLLISKVAEERKEGSCSSYKVESFRPSLPSEVVMSAVGACQVLFPETSDFIYNVEMLHSQAFATQLHELAVEEFKWSMCIGNKAEKEFIEYREVQDPFLITDWIAALLVPGWNQKSSVKVSKKIRDEINCKRSARAVPFRRSGMWTSIKIALHLKILQVVGIEHDARIIYKCLILRILTDLMMLYDQMCGRLIDTDLAGQMLAKLGQRVRKLQNLKLIRSAFSKEVKDIWCNSLQHAHTGAVVLNDKMRLMWNEACAANVSDIIEPILRTRAQFQDDLLHFIPWLNEYIVKQNSAASMSSAFAKVSPKKEDTRMKSSQSGQSKSKPEGSLQTLKRFTSLNSILEFGNGSLPSATGVQKRVWLYDTERFIKFQLMDEVTEVVTSATNAKCIKRFCKAVLDLVLVYTKNAVSFYSSGNGNPLGISQMLLSTLRAVQVLDQIATMQYPLLIQYKAGISPIAFDKLLLPHLEDMSLLDIILNYFRERDRKAEYPGLLDNLLTDVSESSFASRFVAMDDEMGKCLKKMLQDTEDSIKEKQKQVDRAREQCVQMKQDFEEKQASCEACKEFASNEDCVVSEAKKCKECSKLEDEIEVKRYSIPVYERLLPVEPHLQNAVVFEVLIPEEIKSLREALALLKFDLLKEQPDKTGKGNTMQVKWSYFKNIQSYRKQQDDVKYITLHTQLNVNLGSRLLPTTYTHLTKIKNPDLLGNSAVRGEQDVEAWEWPFVVSNGMDCMYHFASSRDYFKTSQLQQLCAFQVSTTRTSSVLMGGEKVNPYAHLQWAVEGTTHSQNRILAEFSATHYPELIAFGSVRAGHRLQLMNLYRYIASKQLQLEKEPVLLLLLQTLWEIGPRTDYNDGPRESHLDLYESEFTEEMLQLIENLVQSNNTNYANPLILASVIVITCRIMELNPDFRVRCYKLLKTCRTCADSWIEVIQCEIENQNDSKRGQVKEEDDRHWTKMLLEITICSALTYNVCFDLFDHVLKDGGDLMNWFDTLSRLHELSQQAESCTKLLSPFGRLLLDIAKDVPLKLNLETQLSSSPVFKDLFIKSLHVFCCQKWDWTVGAGTWKLMEDNPLSNIVEGRYQHHELKFDLVQGKFLVDGYSRSKIPEAILQHHLYELYFQGSRKLKVVQAGVQQNGLYFYRTTDKFHGKHYEFELQAKSGSMIIREMQDDTGEKFELLDPQKFQGFLGDEQVYLYSHWIDLNKKVVYFRKLPTHEGDYGLPPEYTLKSHDTTKLWLLHDQVRNCYVLNPKSQGFAIVSGALIKLEKEMYMSIVMKCSEDGEEEEEDKEKKKPSQILVELPRHHLHFILDEKGYLQSVEYKGFKVAYNQAQRGTLIGLQHGLLLDNIIEDGNMPTPGGNVVKRLLLIPHGKPTPVSAAGSGNPIHHHRTTMSLTHLRQPPFFSYELDPVLKRLKADKSKCAWLYLGLLHAMTSSGVSCLPDPFTEITGTEMAMQILQSAAVWSCSPYDAESVTTLKLIRNLTPRREYYGHGLVAAVKTQKKRRVSIERSVSSPEPDPEQMETTDWPAGIPSMTAYDGYAIVVDRLVRDSNKLRALYPAAAQEESSIFGQVDSYMEKSRWNEKLTVRAYYRHLPAYNKMCVVQSHFFQTSASKFNEDLKEPELLIRRRPGLRDGEEEDEYHNLNLHMLLRMAQVRLLRRLEDPMNASRRKSDLYKFLIGPRDSVEAGKREVLYSAYPIDNYTSSVPLKDVLEGNFRENWLKFYTMAVEWAGSVGARQAFSVVLCALAYQGAPFQQLVNLHNINVLAGTINFPCLPEPIRECMFEGYANEEEGFCEDKIRKHLQDVSKGGFKYSRVSYYQQHSRVNARDNQRQEMEELIDKIIFEIRQLWPCVKMPRRVLDELHSLSDKFWSIHDLKEVNRMLTHWYRNYMLKQFVEKVESYLDGFYEHFPETPPHGKQFDLMEELKLEMKIVEPPASDDCPFEHASGITLNQDLDEAGVIFVSGCSFPEANIEGMIPTQREQCQAKIEKYLERIRMVIIGTHSKNVIFMGGLAPRTSPLYLLQCLLYGLKQSRGSLQPSFLRVIGALGVLWSELKRFNRIMLLSQSRNTLELKNELENRGRENWSPVEYTYWLVLELELDITIRKIQVDVALQMMRMPNGKSGVMQLNMGEGKTSVIVPMLCTTLSDPNSILCRVTVLSSIFKINLNLLSFAIGGSILSQRVYYFPCRRDMSFDLETLDKVLDSYTESLKMKGVVLTLPEWKLSFKLLAFDKTLKGHPEVGERFLKIDNGLRRYCRDIMDESDELLNVKYQLVYTCGAQVPVDGGSLRWAACQKLLQIVQEVAWVYQQKLGASVVEFHQEQQTAHPEQFAFIRLLDKETYDEFLSLVADELLKELKMTERQKQVTKKFLTQENISQENFKSVLSLYKNDESQLDEIRLLSGYLRRGILTLGLSKRWRVEYGVDTKRNFRRMAVPFRAKDCAMERTEFGHPDLAIMLTHLSYYYSGLTDAQLDEVFEAMQVKPEAESLYQAWCGRFADSVPRFLSKFSGLNMQDTYQRAHLFSLFRKHKGVVDFWLANKVFPKECKQFPGKIVTTAWDLVTENQQLPVSGFSGTNDSSILLPLPISQQDLPILQDTNRMMENRLLQIENGDGHKGFPVRVTCRQILEEMKKDSLKILIDAGALMLECDNEQLAQLWLEVDPDIEAVVYFSKDNELMVKCRREYEESEDMGNEVILLNSRKKSRHYRRRDKTMESEQRDIPLELSPYRDNLQCCGVFLDDQHTRGTDLRFPVGSRACVTIGSRMRRDKLMQACMRMRQLGNGHTVTFYLSHEAKTKIAKSKDDDGAAAAEVKVTTQAVLDWVTQNSKDHNHEGLVYWTLAGKNYAQKLAAQQFHDNDKAMHPLQRIEVFAKQCVDEEVLTLKDTYGTYAEAELLTNLIPEWFEATHRKLLNVDGCHALSRSIVQRFDRIRDAVTERCKQHIPNKSYLSSGGLTTMEEEQEKEIELEKEAETEEERQVVQPKRMDYVEPSGLHENVKHLVLNGGIISVKQGICPLSDAFAQTSFAKLLQPEAWALAEVYATTDFITVIKASEVDSEKEDEAAHFKTDAYLRPIEFVVSVHQQLMPKQDQYQRISRKSATTTKSTPSSPLQILVLSPFEVNELLPYFRAGKTQTQLHMFSARLFPDQDLLLNNTALQIPRPMVLQELQISLNNIPDGSKCLAALMVASGNLYFASMEEQQAYARFLGMVPRPWTAEQMNAFEKEMIKRTGFLLPKYRRQEMESCHIELECFQKDPIPMVRKLLMCRHAVVSEMAHVSRLLNMNYYVDLP